MNDDLAFVSARLPDYHAYDEEQHRHDSDMRVRAYVGEALTSVQTRLGTVSTEIRAALEAALYRCMFTDQVFVRKFEHADLDAPLVAALVRSDRLLIGYADEAKTVDADGLLGLLGRIDAQYDYRRSPSPLA